MITRRVKGEQDRNEKGEKKGVKNTVYTLVSPLNVKLLHKKKKAEDEEGKRTVKENRQNLSLLFKDR